MLRTNNDLRPCIDIFLQKHNLKITFNELLLETLIVNTLYRKKRVKSVDKKNAITTEKTMLNNV